MIHDLIMHIYIVLIDQERVLQYKIKTCGRKEELPYVPPIFICGLRPALNERRLSDRIVGEMNILSLVI